MTKACKIFKDIGGNRTADVMMTEIEIFKMLELAETRRNRSGERNVVCCKHRESCQIRTISKGRRDRT